MACFNTYDQTIPFQTMPMQSMPMHTTPIQNGSMMQMQGNLPALPTGLPTGPSPTPLTPPGLNSNQFVNGNQVPQTVQSTMFTPGFLRTQIGRRVRVEFLIGTNGPMVDRIGTLLGVGASYILIRPIDTDDVLLCDIYSIKFVTFYL